MSTPFATPTPAELGALLRGESAPEEPTAELEVPEDSEPAATESTPAPEEGPAEPAATEPDGDDAATPGDAEPGAQDGAGVDAQPEDDVLTVRDVADRLGVKASELYQQMRVGMPDGRGDVTLDELKGAYLERADLEDQRSELTLERTEYQAVRDSNQLEDLRSRQELSTLMSFVRQLPPELVQHAQRAHTDELSRQGEQLMNARPEWRDPQVRTAAADEHMGVLADFGISRAEYQTIGDHRLILVADELCRLRRERQEALDALRKAREAAREPTPRTGTRRAGKPAQRATRPRTNGTGDTVAKVGALIRGDTTR